MVISVTFRRGILLSILLASFLKSVFASRCPARPFSHSGVAIQSEWNKLVA
jgi:hypothetical protein